MGSRKRRQLEKSTTRKSKITSLARKLASLDASIKIATKTKLTKYQVLKPSNPYYEALVNNHVVQFPQEKDCLLDTAPIIFPRQKYNPFIPIGHVSLDFMPTAIIDPAQGRIGATSLFISPAIRGLDFARQAVEAIRAVGRRYARFVVAEVPVRETDEAVERFVKFGDGRPQVRFSPPCFFLFEDETELMWIEFSFLS